MKHTVSFDRLSGSLIKWKAHPAFLVSCMTYDPPPDLDLYVPYYV